MLDRAYLLFRLILSHIDVEAAVEAGGDNRCFGFAFFGDGGSEVAALDDEEVMAFVGADFHFAGCAGIHSEDGVTCPEVLAFVLLTFQPDAGRLLPSMASHSSGTRPLTRNPSVACWALLV